MNIAVLDGYTLNPGDLSWDLLETLGKVTIYEYTNLEEIVPRSLDADILLVNKVILSEEILSQLPQLKCICVTATGTNNIDHEAAKKRGIPVYNAVGYSSPSVAQHVFALLLYLTNSIAAHNVSVKAGNWASNRDFSFWLHSIPELKDRTMGIYGFGNIGQSVAKIAQAFGMKILATHKHPKRDAKEGVNFVDLPTLFEQSDVISLHAPLGANNQKIVNKELLSKMKPTAYLINTARGGLIHEEDLYAALKNKELAAAALDVLNTEPPTADHPLMQLDNCVITPHMAWASKASRQRLLEITVENIKTFLCSV
ncbi:MAG: D-2-hydroxyacid dehydrogenase [Bacteroidota bacterium]